MKKTVFALGVFGLILLFVSPVWPYSQSWGVRPVLTAAAIFAVLGALRGLKLI